MISKFLKIFGSTSFENTKFTLIHKYIQFQISHQSYMYIQTSHAVVYITISAWPRLLKFSHVYYRDTTQDNNLRTYLGIISLVSPSNIIKPKINSIKSSYTNLHIYIISMYMNITTFLNYKSIQKLDRPTQWMLCTLSVLYLAFSCYLSLANPENMKLWGGELDGSVSGVNFIHKNEA